MYIKQKLSILQQNWYTKAKDEVTCNAIEAIQTAENFADEFTQTMADLQYTKAEAEEQLNALQKFFRKIKLALNNILDRIRNKRSGDLMITAEGKVISKDVAMVNDLLKKVRQGLVNVRTNYDAYIAGAEVKSAGDGRVKHMYDGEITAGTSEEERHVYLKEKVLVCIIMIRKMILLLVTFPIVCTQRK